METEKQLKKYITSGALRNWCIGFLVLGAAMAVVQPMLFLVMGIWAALFGICWAVQIARRNSRINALKASGEWERVLQDFTAAKILFDGKVRAGENYLFAKGAYGFMKYEEILWLYRFVQRYLFIPISSCAMIGNSKGKVKGFCSLKKGNAAGGAQIKELATIVYTKNPKVILGFGPDKQKQFKALTKQR